MSRKNRAPKREVLADPLYNSKIVTRLINRVMLDGKRGTADRIRCFRTNQRSNWKRCS